MGDGAAARLATAEKAREAGNEQFKAGEYALATQHYDSALEHLESMLPSADGADGAQPSAEDAAARESVTKCRLNKAACLLKLQGYIAAGNEARAVLAADPGNAKAHFRLGQAANNLSDYATAQRSLTESIKLNPSAREPREVLEALRARLKANPRLEQATQDMTLIEERGLRALNSADLKAARQQLELLLKDARAHGETHWECRALLGLAILCEDDGESEGAQDYLAACNKRMVASDDRRAELYSLQVSALICVEEGQYEQALSMLAGGLAQASQMGEKGIAARMVGNLALAHTLGGDHKKGIEFGAQAVALAKVQQAHARCEAQRDRRRRGTEAGQ